jgi:hypothetical protein
VVIIKKSVREEVVKKREKKTPTIPATPNEPNKKKLQGSSKRNKKKK